jgi:hypothetical protein
MLIAARNSQDFARYALVGAGEPGFRYENQIFPQRAVAGRRYFSQFQNILFDDAFRLATLNLDDCMIFLF